MKRFQPLARLIDLHDGFRRRIKIDALEVLLVQEDGRCFIFESRCPHQQWPLDRAEIIDGILCCPKHQYRFDLVSGEALGALCPSLAVCELVYEGNEVGILLE